MRKDRGITIQMRKNTRFRGKTPVNLSPTKRSKDKECIFSFTYLKLRV